MMSSNELVISWIDLDDNNIQEENLEEVGEMWHSPNNQELPSNSNSYIPKNIYDTSQWNYTDIKLKDLLIEKGPIRILDINFSKHKHLRHFSTIHYKQKLANGEKHEKKMVLKIWIKFLIFVVYYLV